MRSTDSLEPALADAAAAAWIALGAQLEGLPMHAVVDLEGLVVATARLGDRADARTRGVALDWCVRFGSVISGNRLMRVAEEALAIDQTASFAATVAASGGPAWPIAVRGQPSASEIRDRVRVADLVSTSRLAWRLRAAFGAVSRADILLAVLLSPVPLTVAEIARRARYTKGAVAAAIPGLALAGLIEVVRVGHEDRVSLAPDSVVAAWRPSPALPYIDWVARWKVGLEVLDCLAATRDLGTAAAAVQRRASVSALQADIHASALPRVDTKVLGEAFAIEYERWAEAIAADFVPV